MVKVKSLNSHPNVLFLSILGDRPEADMLSGGDYDGDLVWVCWDENIVKHIKQMDPTQYPTLPKEKKKNLTKLFQEGPSWSSEVSSSYEAKRRKNIKRNAKVLMKLGSGPHEQPRKRKRRKVDRLSQDDVLSLTSLDVQKTPSGSQDILKTQEEFYEFSPSTRYSSVFHHAYVISPPRFRVS
jgi:hypothetical protein